MQRETLVLYQSGRKAVKHNLTGIIRLEVPAGTVLLQGGRSDNGRCYSSGAYRQGTRCFLKQEQHLTYGDDDRIRKLYIALGRTWRSTYILRYLTVQCSGRLEE